MMRTAKAVRPRFVLLTTLALCVTVFAAACSSSGTSKAGGGGGGSSNGSSKLPSTIVIGATLPLTGPGGAYGKIMQTGLQMGLADAAAAGVVGSSKFNLQVRDDQAQAGLAVSQTRDLVNSGAMAIVSAFTAPPLAQLPIAARAHIPVFNGGGDDPSLLGQPYLWNDVLMVNEEATAGMGYLYKTLNVKTIGILFENDYTPAALAGLQSAWKTISGSDAPSQSVDQAATDAGPQLDKLLANKPDALYLAVDGNIASLTYKELAQRNVKIPVMTYSGGATVPEATSTPGLNLYYTAQSFTPTAQFQASATKAGVSTITYLHETYYNIGQTIAGALKMASSQGLGTNGEALEKVLEKSPGVSFSGCCGDVTYTATHGSNSKATVSQIVDGKPVVKAESSIS